MFDYRRVVILKEGHDFSTYVSHLGHFDYAHITWINATGRSQFLQPKNKNIQSLWAGIFFASFGGPEKLQTHLEKGGDWGACPEKKHKKAMFELWTNCNSKEFMKDTA